MTKLASLLRKTLPQANLLLLQKTLLCSDVLLSD